MASVVITGATGFLGRCVTDQLVRSGHMVIPVSRRGGPGLVQVSDYSESPAADVMIHLAEESDRGRANARGDAHARETAAVVRALTRRGYQRVIYASSGVVYGTAHETPCTIETAAAGTDVYSRSKLTNEQTVLEAHGVAVRLSNLFGPGMAPTNVFSDILRQIPGTGPIRVRDDQPVCDFLAVSDAASAVALLAGSTYRGVLNVGSGRGTSVKALAGLILAAANQSARDVIATARSSVRSFNVLDISATRRLLGWAPARSLEDHLRHLVAAGS